MIIVCEPVCRGFEHAEVNAAMLAVIAEAFRGKEILFLADKEHLDSVAANPLLVPLAAVTFEPLTPPPRKISKEERFQMEYENVKAVFELAQQRDASLVLFTCVSEETLKAIKLIKDVFQRVRIFTVLHSILASLLKRPSFWFWKNRDTFRTRFLRDNGENLKYILLGESIERELVARFPLMAPHLISIDLPYNYALERDHSPFTGRTVAFGSLGVLRKVKGSHEFLRLAREIRQMDTVYNSDFVCIGPVVDKKIRKLITNDVTIPSPDASLTAEEFAGYANKLDYAVFLHTPEAYALTASGVLFDAFSYLKPIIAIKSPFISNYFERMGNIGYLCEDYEELKSTVLRILNEPPVDEYRLQRRNLSLGRQALQIPMLAARLLQKTEKIEQR
jgi:hypothetical protein